MTIKKANTDFYLKIISNGNLYNAPVDKFKCIIVKESDGTATSITSGFEEIILDVDGNTSTLSGDIPSGSKFVPVDDGSQFQDGDVIKIDSSYYYIESISGNVLTTREKSQGHASDATVLQVGNTGVYRFLVNLPETGFYTAIVSNREINMQNTTTAIEIVDYTVSDIIDKSKQKSFI